MRAGIGVVQIIQNTKHSPANQNLWHPYGNRRIYNFERSRCETDAQTMRHQSELGVNSEQHQSDIEVILQRRRNEIEFNVVKVFACSFSFGGRGVLCTLTFTFKNRFPSDSRMYVHW